MTILMPVNSPLGRLHLARNGEHLTHLFLPDRPLPTENCKFVESDPLLNTAAQQLAEYFRRERQSFALPLLPQGTDFQRAVWQELSNIPYGSTVSYAEIARRIGRPNACRAVGQANGRNPLPIFLPCHRVIGAGGSLTGYTGGLHIKTFLLKLEK